MSNKNEKNKEVFENDFEVQLSVHKNGDRLTDVEVFNSIQEIIDYLERQKTAFKTNDYFIQRD